MRPATTRRDRVRKGWQLDHSIELAQLGFSDEQLAIHDSDTDESGVLEERSRGEIFDETR